MLAAREATVQGRLYDLPYGFPALVVPEEDVQAIGTTNYLADTKKQNNATPITRAISPGWDAVHGELFSFDDPEERLPALDALEGFRPGEQSFYKRVLVPAELVPTGTTVLAWAYATESASGMYLPGGHWPVS